MCETLDLRVVLDALVAISISISRLQGRRRVFISMLLDDNSNQTKLPRAGTGRREINKYPTSCGTLSTRGCRQALTISEEILHHRRPRGVGRGTGNLDVSSSGT